MPKQPTTGELAAEMTEEQIKAIRDRSIRLSKMGQDFVRTYMGLAPGNFVRGMNPVSYDEIVAFGEQLRDYWIHQYAILPGALNSFVEVAASREWMISGTPRGASRAVEKLNNFYFEDNYGIKYSGFEDSLSRLCMDWLCVGRCAFYSKRSTNGTFGDLEYLDSTRLTPKQLQQTNVKWQYRDRFEVYEIPQRDVFFNDCVRLGGTGMFVGKVAYIIPMARLDWYMREHDTTRLDGRKLRDILFVANDDMVQAVEDAVESVIALALGSTVEQSGLPVVAVNMMGYQGPLQDLIAKLGLSEIPEEFKRAEFEFRYVNEISANLGLNLRYFWNDPRGTNRSLEQVNQERQSVQGPSFFIRSMTRTINNSKVLDMATQKVRLEFEEEVDSTALLRKAETLAKYAEGVEKIYDLVSPKLTGTPQLNAEGKATGKVDYEVIPRENAGLMQPESILNFFERMNLFPTDLTMPELASIEEDALQGTSFSFSHDKAVKDIEELERRANLDPLDYGQVRMSLTGKILERRNKIVPVGRKLNGATTDPK